MNPYSVEQQVSSIVLEDIERRHFVNNHNISFKPRRVRFGTFEWIVQKKLAKAGIQINGPNAFDIQISDRRAYRMIAIWGSLGLGESYMAGYWNVSKLDQFIERIFRSTISRRRFTPYILAKWFQAAFLNLQSHSRSQMVCDSHYDLGNELFTSMLDSNMVYTCGYWKNAKDLEEAQIAKMDLLCQKLGLKPGMKLLDIGCGFGSLMKYAAINYGVTCVGYSLSREQIAFGKTNCAGLPVEFIFGDYRDIRGSFDRVVSVGMMEAVGYKNYRTYMETINRVLNDDGYAVIHTVGHNLSTTMADPWVDKYIFPNGTLPSIAQIGRSIEGIFVMEDWHNFGPDYYKTLLAWNNNFQCHWPVLRTKYSERFKRMWEFYLLSFAGGFKARNWQLWQIVLTKKGRGQPLCRIS